MKKRNLIIKCIILFVFSLISFGLSYFFFLKSNNNFSQDVVNYKEDNDVDYKVYLKENNFFEESFLGKGDIYITNLIDYLDVDYKNSIIFDKKISGSYKYYIKAMISASKVNDENSNFWQKEYDLSDVKTVNYNDTNVIAFNENVKVDYQKYNDLLLKFKQQYNLSLDGTLKVTLYVENTINGENGTSIDKKSYSILSIPLTKATIEVPIEITSDKKSDSLKSEIVYSNDKIYLIYKIVSIFMFALAILLVVFISILFIKQREKVSVYHKKINRILKEYDGIIVNLKKSISLAGLNVIDVSSFSELIDAHSEVRQPINYIASKNKAEFILINDKMAWRYVLLRDE